MPLPYRHDLVDKAKELRKNMTKQERKLWYEFLRTYPLRFQRQKPIGNYIVDFYCAEAKLVIELDGSQHYTDDGPINDAERTAALEAHGVAVLRVPNNEVTSNFEGVCLYIDAAVKRRI